MKIEEILKLLDENCNLEDGLTSTNFYDRVETELSCIDDFIEAKTGASKGVLFFKGLDVVIKIPFDGYSCESYWGDDEEEVSDFYEFVGADGDFDYCRVEANIYKEAKKESLERFFAETKLVGEIQGRSIYTQPIVEPFYQSNTHESFNNEDIKYVKIKDKLEKIAYKHCYNYIKTEWLYILLKMYGYKMFRHFLDFIHSMGINDLHNGNIGYSKDGRPILLDYSGYND